MPLRLGKITIYQNFQHPHIQRDTPAGCLLKTQTVFGADKSITISMEELK